MKTALAALGTIALTIGLLIELGWLALVVLPVAVLFVVMVVTPLLVKTPPVVSAETPPLTSSITPRPAFGD